VFPSSCIIVQSNKQACGKANFFQAVREPTDQRELLFIIERRRSFTDRIDEQHQEPVSRCPICCHGSFRYRRTTSHCWMPRMVRLISSSPGNCVRSTDSPGLWRQPSGNLEVGFSHHERRATRVGGLLRGLQSKGRWLSVSLE
jgi:hypothetical protein